jgi:hypothetical protein
MQVIEGVTSVSPKQELLYKLALEETLLNQGIIVTDDQIVIIYVFTSSLASQSYYALSAQRKTGHEITLTSGIVTITGEQSFMCVEYSYLLLVQEALLVFRTLLL